MLPEDLELLLLEKRNSCLKEISFQLGTFSFVGAFEDRVSVTENRSMSVIISRIGLGYLAKLHPKRSICILIWNFFAMCYRLSNCCFCFAIQIDMKRVGMESF